MNIDYMSKRKELSDEDKQAAERLRCLWYARKQSTGQSQSEIAAPRKKIKHPTKPAPRGFFVVQSSLIANLVKIFKIKLGLLLTS